MDNIEFITENSEYKIRITKKKKFFSQSDFGQYNCTIEFYNNINMLILNINCTEFELYTCIQRLSELGTNIIMGTSDEDILSIIEFNSTGDFNNYFWVATTTNLSNYPDYPTDEDIMCCIMIYSTHLGENSLRIYLPMTYSFLDVIVYNIYQVLEDIPYLNNMNDKMIQMIFYGEEIYKDEK